MPIKYNNFDIGNAYLGNDNLVAMYQGSNLVWTNGIKLKSLLGKQNTEQSITLSSPLNLNTAVGFGMSGNGITYPNNLWGGSYGKPIEIKETHYYLYAIKVNKNVLSTANTWGGFYFATQGGYIDNQTMAYTDGEWYLGIQKANKSLINDNFFGIFARSLALNTGDIITCYKSFILDLTQAKLDTLTAQQVYDLITLNGTDFTNLELLGAGYEIKLGSFKSQDKLIEGGLSSETAQFYYDLFFSTLGMSKMYVPYGKRFESSDNIILGTKYGIIDLGEPTWYKYTRGSNWIFYATIPNGKRYGDINGLNVDYWFNSSKWKINQKTNNGGGTASGEDLQVFWDASNSQLLIKDMSFTDGGGNIKNYLKGCYLVYPLAEPNGTDYNDLTAKQMYDMLNTNKIDVIADGKSVGGVRSLLGVQNIPLTITNDDANIRVASKNNSFSSSYAEGKLFSVIANHKYFVCYYGYFQNNVPDGFALVKYENNAPSTLGSVYANQTGFTLEKGKAYGGIILVGESTSNALLANRYWAGITDWHFYTKGDVIEGAVVIDLTEHNLQNLTAQEAYQYFKENNLNILDNRGEIDIGGYIKS